VTEPFLTVPEIARILRVDRHTVCRLFADEPGVVVIGNRETRRGQRKYRMLRVPTAVLNRVVARYVYYVVSTAAFALWTPHVLSLVPSLT
jgi:hypothetical protein